MSPIEDDLLADFRTIMLEVLVPLEVQRRIPGVRDHWRIVLASKEGDKAFKDFFARVLKERRPAGEIIRERIAKAASDKDVATLKNALYTRVGRDRALISSFFRRPITNGNEQCPYWDKFNYQERPKLFGGG